MHHSIQSHIKKGICFFVEASVRLQAGTSPQQAISDIGAAWAQVFPEHPFEYFFLDDYYDQQFKTERQFSSVFSLFAGVAVFIGCLGILGMALFESNARIKEISIRKILGASAGSLLALLSQDQVRCLLVSCVVSIPLVWYAADWWLSTYPSQIGMSATILLVPVMVIASTVMVISALQVFNAARVNPVEPLRSE